MAAIYRSLFPQLLAESSQLLLRAYAEPLRSRIVAHHLSSIASLQPEYPAEVDENLFEEPSTEYRAKRTLQPAHRTLPCDSLFSAVLSGKHSLATELLNEHLAGKIPIVQRKEYAEMAKNELKNNHIDLFLSWLHLCPPTPFQFQDANFVNDLTRHDINTRHLMRLSRIFVEKGWPAELIAIALPLIIRHTPSADFLSFFNDILGHQPNEEGSVQQEILHNHWRAIAIHTLCTAKDPLTAYKILSPSGGVVHPVPAYAVQELLKLARLEGYNDIHAHLFHLLPFDQRSPISETNTPSSIIHPDDLVQNVRRKGTASAMLRILKKELVKNQLLPPAAIATFLHDLENSYGNNKVIDLLRRRVRRLGDRLAKRHWAAVELYLFLEKGDPLSAMIFFKNSFHLEGAPFFLQAGYHGEGSIWESWLQKKSQNQISKPDSKFEQSSSSFNAVWKAASMLSMRNPIKPYKKMKRRQTPSPPGRRETWTRDSNNLIQLFQDALAQHDRAKQEGKALLFSRFHTIHFFRIFLNAFVTFIPQRAHEVIQAMQNRGLEPDVKCWVMFARTKLELGETPRIILSALESISKQGSLPVDFRPTSLLLQKKSTENTASRETPRTLLKSYNYALGALIRVQAFEEAVQVYEMIIDAGYRRGTSVVTDRLFHELQGRIRELAKNEGLGDLQYGDSRTSQNASSWELLELLRARTIPWRPKATTKNRRRERWRPRGTKAGAKRRRLNSDEHVRRHLITQHLQRS